MEVKDNLQIVLLGTTGSGKSASGNTILGKKVFKSYASTQSVTLSYQSETRTINGMEVTVVDTPGWYCTKMNEKEVESALMAAIASLNGPYAFLMVIPIGSFTQKEIQMISNLSKLLGKEFINQTTILFSYSDNLESKSFEQFLEEEKGKLHTIVKDCENRVYTCNNKNISVCNLNEMLQDLKKTQRINDNSKKRCQNTEISQQEHDLNTFDKTELSDVDMKRTKIDTPERLNKPNEEVRVVVLGMAGVGKTSTIRTLLGQNFQIESSTPKVHTTSRSGMNFKLIDSSGFKNENTVESVISQSFSDASPGPHVIMSIIAVGQVSEETLKMINEIHARLDSFIKHTMIVFSGKDELKDKTINEFIKEYSALKNIVELYESKFCALNNKDINDQLQVNELFEKISAIYHHNDRHFAKEPSGQHERVNEETEKKENDSLKKAL